MSRGYRNRAIHTRTLVLCVATAALAALAIGCGGDTSSGPGPAPPPAGPAGPYLAQIVPGAAPSIRLSIATPSIPSPSQVFGFLIFRAEGQAYFNPTADRLIDVVEANRLPAYDDDPVPRFGVTYSGTRNFIGPGGTLDSYTVTATYNDPALQVGSTYYYRVQRLIDPRSTVVPASLPASWSLQAATLDISRSDVLSQPSAPLGPVTYFGPPTQVSPADGAQGIQLTNVRFRWNRPSVGGGRGPDEYVVDIFGANDPGTLGNPLYRSPPLTPVGTGGQMTWDLTGVQLQQAARFYWRVGARRRGEAYPRTDTLSGALPYLWSDIRGFETGIAPPPTP